MPVISSNYSPPLYQLSYRWLETMRKFMSDNFRIKYMSEYFSCVENLVRSRGWFRSTDLWVMGPARFLCATLLRTCFEISAISNQMVADATTSDKGLHFLVLDAERDITYVLHVSEENAVFIGPSCFSMSVMGN